MSKKIYHIDLPILEEEELKSIIKKRKSTSQHYKRSKILLAANRNGEKKWTDSKIASQYEVSIRTIERLRLHQRYVEEDLSVVLNGKPRLNLHKKLFDSEVEARLIALCCSEPE